MVQGERAKGRAGIEGEGDMWNHFPYPCPSGKAHHKKLFQMKKSENANGHEAIRRKKKVTLTNTDKIPRNARRDRATLAKRQLLAETAIWKFH